MHRLINLVVLCACVSVSVSHVLSHTTNDLVDTASGRISDTVIQEPDVKISSLDVIIEYIVSKSSNSVVTLNRYRRNFIYSDDCPQNQVRIKTSRCYTCAEYERITEEDCPLKQ